MTLAGAKALALKAIVELETALLRQPPAGVTHEAVADFFGRYRRRLTQEFRVLLRQAPRQPLCTICRRQRGTNLDCERCESFRWMRDNPPTEAEKEASRAQLRQAVAEAKAREQTRRSRLEGRLVLIGLVGCGRTKAPAERAAKDLYLGTLFQSARAYAEAFCDEWIILSARHGVLPPDDLVEPYEQSMSSMRLSEREAWGQRVSSSLNERYRGLRVRYVGLAGSEYLRHLRLQAPLDEPLDRMGIGTRIKYLRDAVTEATGDSR